MFGALLGFVPCGAAFAAELPWIGNDGSWQLGANWQTVAEPAGLYFGDPRDGDQARIDNMGNNVVTLNDDTAVLRSLDISNGNRVVTNGHSLRSLHFGWTGNVGIADDARLEVAPVKDGGPGLETNRLSIVDDGLLLLRDDAIVHANDNVWLLGTIAGNGTLRLGTNLHYAHMQNRGTIRVAPITSGEHTLRLQAMGESRFDLSGGVGTQPIIDVDGGFAGNANQQTLIVDGPLSDDFNGTLKIGADDTVEFKHAWNAAGAIIELNGARAPATLKGAPVRFAESVINTTSQSTNVIESDVNWVTGQLNLPQQASLEFAGTTTITSNPLLLTPGIGQKIIFSGDATLNRGSFKWEEFETTVRGGSLTLKAVEIDIDSSIYNGQLNIIDGFADVEVSFHGGRWTNAGQIELENGTLRGSELENAFQIRGSGIVDTEGFNNNGSLTSIGGTLQISKPEASAGIISLDGFDSSFYAGGQGEVNATEGNILVTSPFDSVFNGRMLIGSGHSFTTNQPTLSIAEASGEKAAGELHLAGGTVSVAGNLFQSGVLSVEADNARIQAELVSFEATGQNHIHADLLLEANSRIGFNASFSGSGRMVNLQDSTMYIPEGATVPLVIRNEGDIVLGAEFSTSRFEVKDFDQSANGSLLVNLNGNELGQFDRLIVDGMASLAGQLQLVLNEGYAPLLYDPSTVIHAAAGVDSTFDTVRGVMYADGLGLAVTYSGKDVTVTAALLGDTDLDGTVAFADFLQLSSSFGNGGTWQDGDFDGDGRVKFADFLALSGNFGAATEATSQSVPEPSGACLLVGSLALLLNRKKRLFSSK